MAWGKRTTRWSKYTKKKVYRRKAMPRLAGKSWGVTAAPRLNRGTIKKRFVVQTELLLGPGGYAYPDDISGLFGSNWRNVAQDLASTTGAARLSSGTYYKEQKPVKMSCRWTPLYTTFADMIAASPSAQYGQSQIAYGYTGAAQSNAGNNITLDNLLEWDNAKAFSIFTEHTWTTDLTGSTGGKADWGDWAASSTSNPGAQFGSWAVCIDNGGSPGMTPVALGSLTLTFEVLCRTPCF